MKTTNLYQKWINMGMSDADVFGVLDKLTRKAYEEKLLGK